MHIDITPCYGFIVGFNYLDWGAEFEEEYNYRYEFQIGLGLFIIQLKR